MNEQNSKQRKATAFLFIFFLLFLYKEMIWDAYFHPNTGQQNQGPAQKDPNLTPQSTAAPAATAMPAWSQPTGTPAPGGAASTSAGPAGAASAFNQDQNLFPTDQQLKEGGLVEIETSTQIATVTRTGGRLKHLRLKEYKTAIDPASPLLDLVEHVETAPLPFGIYTGTVNDGWVNYTVASVDGGSGSGDRYQVKPGEKLTLVLTGTLPDQRGITKKINFSGDGYIVGVDVALAAPAADKSRLEFEWTKLIQAEAASIIDPYNTSGYTWFDGAKAHRQPFTNLEASPFDLGEVVWASQGDKYFMEAMIASGAPAPARAIKVGQLYGTRLSGADSGGNFQLFLGPKSYQILAELGRELKLNIDFGMTGFIAAPLLFLLHFFYGLLHNYGLAIIALTLLVKGVLYPLNASSYRQMKAMSDLTPEVQRIRETVKDKQQQQLEMMNLYKKRGVNPFGGCLPILLQMPIFFGLYSALMLAIELRHAPFALWISDLAGPEKLIIGGVTIPVMVILFTASMLVQQWMTPSNLDPTQKKVMLVMPVVFGFMFMGFPAGLTLYWLTNNLISIGQQKALKTGNAKSAMKITALVSFGLFGFAWALAKLWPAVH